MSVATRSTLALLTLATLAATSFADPATKPAAPTSRPTRVKLDGAGVSFEVPKGWSLVSDLDPYVLGRYEMWVDGKMQAVMQIGMEPLRTRTARRTADRTVQEGRGAAMRSIYSPISKQAFEVTSGVAAKGVGSVTTILEADNRTIRVVLNEADAGLDAALLQQHKIVETLAVTAPLPPADNLELRTEAVRLPGSSIEIRLPKAFEQVELWQKETVLAFDAYDWALGDMGASVTVQLVGKMPGERLSRYLARTTFVITNRAKFDGPFRFDRVSESPESFVSFAIPFGKEKTSIWIAIGLDDAQYALMRMTFRTADDETHKKYVAAAQAIAASVTTAKP